MATPNKQLEASVHAAQLRGSLSRRSGLHGPAVSSAMLAGCADKIPEDLLAKNVIGRAKRVLADLRVSAAKDGK